MSSNKWTLLGPTGVLDGQMHLPSTPDGPTIAGRVTCLVRGSGTSTFIGTAGGGVWHSPDDGVTWRSLTDFLPCASIGALAFDAANNRLWIGSGEGNRAGRAMFGQGLFTLDTTTVGNASPTIARMVNLPAPRGADDFRRLRSAQILLEPNAANPPIVWWGTNEGLFRSTDSGANWTQVTFNGAARDDVASMVLCTSTGTARMLVGLWDQRLYIRQAADPTQFDALTTDLGALAATPTIGQRIVLAVAPSNSERVYLALGKSDNTWDGIYSSNAGGKGWTKVGFPTPTSPQRPLGQSHYNIILAVHPTTPNTLYFGETGIWRSIDGGTTWTDLASTAPGTHSDQHALVFEAANPSRCWLGNDGGIWLSTDGGTTWASRNRGLSTLQYYALVHHPNVDSVLLAGAQDNGTQRFAGHPAWHLIGGGDGFYCGIDPLTPRFWYSSYVYRDGAGNIRAIQRSDAAGASWVPKTGGIDPTEYAAGVEPFYVPFICDPTADSVVWLGTTRLWRTRDRGEGWLAVRKGDGTLFSTTTGAPSSGNSITCITVDPNDANNIYVGTADGQLIRVHIDSINATTGQPTATITVARTTGAAARPDAIEFTDLAVPKLAAGAPLAPVYAVQGSSYLTFRGSEPSAVASGRVWKHDFASGAATDWTALGTTIPAVTFPSGPDLPFQWNFVNAIAIDPTNAQRIFIGCHMGVFESTNGGTAWTATHNSDLPFAPVVDLQFHPTHRLLRGATMGRSVWERLVDAVAPPETQADIYIRDNVIDIGRFDTPVSGADPLAASGTLAWFDAVDIKVDTEAFIGGFETASGTIDYTPGGALDYVGFQRLGSDALQRDVETRVHLQVLNRGPAAASNVKARVYWTDRQPDGNFSALPADFWTLFPDGALPEAGAWHPVAASQTKASVLPGEPHVFTFTFSAPTGLHDVGLFAVVSCDEDPISETRTDVQLVATTNKRTALRRADLNASTGSIVLGVLVAIGAAALIVGAIAATA